MRAHGDLQGVPGNADVRHVHSPIALYTKLGAECDQLGDGRRSTVDITFAVVARCCQLQADDGSCLWHAATVNVLPRNSD